MPYCSSCGNQVAESAAFCPSCGAPVQRTAAQQPSPAPSMAPPIAPPAGYPPYPGYAPMPGEKSPVLAALLSIITGLGQLYNGEKSKGVIFLVVGIILFILMVATTILCIVFIPFWLYGMYDAYIRAEEYNRVLRATGRPPW